MPGGAPDEQRQARVTLQKRAKALRQENIAACLAAITTAVSGCGAPPPPLSHRLYLKQLIREAGDPADPIERMMVEQIVLAHHKVGELYYRSRHVNSPEKVKVYQRGDCCPAG